MDCKGFDEELISYVLGVSSDEARAEMDGHVLGCADCLRHFLEIKRHVERTEGGPRPSPRVKERLREALFVETAPRRFARSLAKPVPLYQALVAAFAIAAIAAIAPRIIAVGSLGSLRGLSATGATRAVTRVDSSRKVPEAAAIY
jgi:anti-sigma factor RsiW